MLHIAAQRTGAELRIVGGIDDILLCGGRQLAAQLLVSQTLVQRGDLEIDDAGDVLLGQRLVEHDLVQTVEEFRTEGVVQERFHGVLRTLGDLTVRADAVKQLLAAEVGGQDDDGVLEIDRAALRVGDAAVVQHLKQNVEHIGCAFSISSKRTTLYGRRRTASVSWPPSS